LERTERLAGALSGAENPIDPNTGRASASRFAAATQFSNSGHSNLPDELAHAGTHPLESWSTARSRNERTDRRLRGSRGPIDRRGHPPAQTYVEAEEVDVRSLANAS
jgi:hypothetical protein